MFSFFYNEYGFQILLCIAIGGLLLIFVYNRLSGNRGSFTNYYDYMVQLFNKPTATSSLWPKRVDPVASSCGSGVSKGEAECKRAVETITGRRFEKTRPSFLRNDVTNSNLELDCYNDELRLAVEYNGEQHYNYVPYFHRTKDAFYNLKYRDDIKRRLCDENGVRLVIVPYTVDIDNIERYIREAIVGISTINVS